MREREIPGVWRVVLAFVWLDALIAIAIAVQYFVLGHPVTHQMFIEVQSGVTFGITTLLVADWMGRS